ncbi:pilus assembly protein [Nesterenkonia sp. AY15]|uniref:TadE family type IV pilus minor pilin n=1 Tax=unclassified Nesterenkonia TaxID=2629769 RepID=UPI001F4C8079|nr:pilus assembly protein [Nesterenkonia sp. YGD6]MCH8572027.1 pilus assembly protein [Nesterenkonia sp. AY15]
MRSRSERGSISAEFAVALPGVVLVLLLVLALGLHGAAQVTLETGARAAARELARGEDPAAAEAAARRVAGEEVSFQLSHDQDYVTVALVRPVRVLGWVEVGMTQDARATARVENLP